MGEIIGIGIVLLIWVVSSLIKGFKWLAGRTAPPLQAPPPSGQAGFQPQASFGNPPPQFQNPPQSQFQNQPQFSPRPQPAYPQAPPPSQAPPPTRPAPVQAPRREQARPIPRQPQAGGPAVPFETDRRDFERQEQDLFASEPTALSVSLSSPAARSAAAPNRLFGGTDDLVRAIILQEVLGPPLSRRSASPLAQPSPPE